MHGRVPTWRDLGNIKGRKDISYAILTTEGKRNYKVYFTGEYQVKVVPEGKYDVPNQELKESLGHFKDWYKALQAIEEHSGKIVKGRVMPKQRVNYPGGFFMRSAEARVALAEQWGETVREKQAKFPPQAMNLNRLKDSDGFWGMKVKDAQRLNNIRLKADGNVEMGDLIFFLNMAAMGWEDGKRP